MPWRSRPCAICRWPRPAAERPRTGGARLRAQFPQSGRRCRRLRQERAGAGRAAAARFRLRRGRHRHPAAASRQSAAAPVPARIRRGRDQPPRLQQRGRGGGAASGSPRAPAKAALSASISAPTATAPTASATTRGWSRPSRRSPAISPSTSPRPTRRACATCSRPRRSTICSPRVLDARERVRPRVGPVPVLVKIAPDLTLSDLDDAVGIARKHRVDGMIVGNTTIARPGALRERDKAQRSGRTVGAAAVQARRPACWRRLSCAPRARSR